MNIPIYMSELLTEELEEQIEKSIGDAPFDQVNNLKTFYGPRASWLLKAILDVVVQERTDEIAILTTSDDIYVSTCISIPSFNKAIISRVVTERTKIVIVIHEFGWIIDDLEIKISQWREKGILIIEDCAHICGIKLGKKVVGSFGDFALFSLPKIIPAKAGGILRTDWNLKLPEMNEDERLQTRLGIQAAEKYLEKMNWFNMRKIYFYQEFETLFTKHIYKPSVRGIPFFMCLWVENKDTVQRSFNNIEFGATLNCRKLYIPNSPLISDLVYQNYCEKLLCLFNR